MNMVQNEMCLVCFGTHHLRFCAAFKTMTVEQREVVVLTHRYCINCLGKNHFVRNCPWRGSCRMCGVRHNTMLHRSMGAAAGRQGGNMSEGRFHPYVQQRDSQMQQQQQILNGLQGKKTNMQLARQHQDEAKRLEEEAKHHIEKAKHYEEKAKKQQQQREKTKATKQKKNQEKEQQQPQIAEQQQQQSIEKADNTQQTPVKADQSQSDRMDRLFNVLERIANALMVAPVQGARHVGNPPNPLDDDIDIDLINLDKSL
ncbi:uncharacterized protein [Musca autumnalis]|uniref:uncharacterized protein n=1 Tax=Musca autumnalis TaxID=221902 RepID=UPI003CF60B13